MAIMWTVLFFLCIGGFANAQPILEKSLLTTMPVGAKCKVRCITDDETVLKREAAAVLKRIFDGASNVFLVKGDAFEEAVSNTMAVYQSGQPVSTPFGDRPTETPEYWIVVFLGTNSSNTTLDSIDLQRNKNDVTITYSMTQGSRRDIVPLFIWVPLGRLPQSNYKLIVRRKGTEEEFTRTVPVP